METKNIILELRTKKEPRKLICQCCGMPIEDDSILGREKDGTLNEEYCKWCYADGTYTYSDMDELIDVCVKHMVNENFTEEQARAYMKELLPKLDYWKRYEELSDNGQFEEFKQQLIREINDLSIEGLPRVDRLNALVGKYVNLEYTLPGGEKVKFLDDRKTYLGNQLESEFGGERCFGILADMDFILVCTYEENGENPELLIRLPDGHSGVLQRMVLQQNRSRFCTGAQSLSSGAGDKISPDSGGGRYSVFLQQKSETDALRTS